MHGLRLRQPVAARRRNRVPPLRIASAQHANAGPQAASKTLQEVSLKDSTAVTDITALSKVRGLKELNITGCSVLGKEAFRENVELKFVHEWRRLP